MKVYLLMYLDDIVYGVYSSEELAKKTIVTEFLDVRACDIIERTVDDAT